VLYQKGNSLGTFYFEYIRHVNRSFEPHMHRHLELIHMRSGKLHLEVDGHMEILTPGMYAWVPSNRVHALRLLAPSVVDVCIFSEDFVPVFAKETEKKKPERYMFCCRDAVDAFAQAELFVENQVPDLYTLKAVLYAIMGDLMQQVSFSKVTGKSEMLLDRIIAYVAENYREDITLKQIADEMGYEVHYVSRCFHSVIPMHFSRFVNLYRVDAAAELLKRHDMSIAEIASESGFQSLRSFNRVFLETTGKTPRNYYERDEASQNYALFEYRSTTADDSLF